MSKIYKIAILGAGASGLMAASILNDRETCIIEVNEEIGKKIKVSGGAKCNITNKYLSSDNYLGDKVFLKQLFKKFDNKKLLSYLNQNQLFPKINEKIVKGTYFCNTSKDVIELFKTLTSRCKFYLGTEVLEVKKIDNIFEIKTNKNIIKAQKVIVCLGSSAYPILGASSKALDIAKSFDIESKLFNSALVGISVQPDEFWFKELSGVSSNVHMKVGNKVFDGSVLFTHKGISGPVVLNTSLYWQKGDVSIDFLPNIDLKKLKRKNGFISTVVPLPKRFMTTFMKAKGIKDKAFSSLTQEEFEKVLLLKDYKFAPAGTLGLSKAEVCKGGVLIDEVDENFESKKIKDLYFLGECLDITGELGGYNFQFAFSSAYVCARNILTKIS